MTPAFCLPSFRTGRICADGWAPGFPRRIRRERSQSQTSGASRATSRNGERTKGVAGTSPPHPPPTPPGECEEKRKQMKTQGDSFSSCRFLALIAPPPPPERLASGCLTLIAKLHSEINIQERCRAFAPPTPLIQITAHVVREAGDPGPAGVTGACRGHLPGSGDVALC